MRLMWPAITKSARYWLKANRICTLYNQIVCIIAEGLRSEDWRQINPDSNLNINAWALLTSYKLLTGIILDKIEPLTNEGDVN